MNKFLQFILSEPDKYDLPYVDGFFDISIPETKYGDKTDKMNKPNYNKIYQKLSSFYPDRLNVI